MIKVEWLGHACFKITCEDYTVILDPYETGSVEGLGPIREEADQVLISHGHGDHNGGGCVTVREAGKRNPFQLKVIDSFHDKKRGEQRGKNRIHILETNGLKLVHLGDIGCNPTPDEMAEMKGAFLLMAPVGGYFTLEPEEMKAVVDEINPTIMIPMHYRGDHFGYEVLAPVEEYLKLKEGVEILSSSVLELAEGMKKQIVVLQPGNLEK